MIGFNLFEIIIDWTMLMFSVSLITIEFPHDGYFKNYSLFAVLIDDEFYLEIFFITLIGQKHYE